MNCPQLSNYPYISYNYTYIFKIFIAELSFLFELDFPPVFIRLTDYLFINDVL